MMNRTWLLVPLTLLLGGAVVGCDVQPPINRVQPNVTRKADILGGEWYFLSTVVDTPYTTSFTFVGEQGDLERIVWEIQEDYLVARRSYETIQGSEPGGINGGADGAGAAVAMYRIESHFDIKHDYNPVTGERLNVLVENTTDRPWFEREYMRVDWSENLIGDPNFMMLSRYFDNAMRLEPVKWHVQDDNDPETPPNPNAPRFERLDPQDENSPLAYMEITNKMFAKPETVDWGFGPIPVCFLVQYMYGDPVDCAPNEITVRHSFLRVDPNREYQPTVYTGDRMERFGYFVIERPGYDQSYGTVEPLRYRFIKRHNIWAESYKKNSNGEYILCTEDEQCADGRGSFCDLDWGRANRVIVDDRIQGACTIPYRDRQIRPIVYHTSENWPDDLMPEAQLVATEYSAAFNEVVASLRENECLEHEPEGTDCSAERTREAQGSLFYVCESPVPEGAPEVCGPPGTVARIGDLRFNLLGYVNEPHRASPLGYGPSAGDPLTGEIIAGNAFIYGAGLETAAARGRDIVRLLNGDITEEDVQAGIPVEEWAARLSSQMEGRSMRSADDHVVPVDAHSLPRINAAMDFSWARVPANPGTARGRTPSDRMEEVRDRLKVIEHFREALARINNARILGNGTDEPSAALRRLRGTQFEDLMTTPEMLAMAGLDPSLPLDDSVIASASPLRGQNYWTLFGDSRVWDLIQQHQGVDFADFADNNLLGLAREIKRAADERRPIEWNGVEYSVVDAQGKLDYNAVRMMLRHPIMSGLVLHEVGHTVGLRHNFSGSFDALNYHPRYWELRDDGHMHPRAWDPITEAEINGRIYEYSYSTVMDYGHNFVVSDAQGLGHYDRAALKMGYGDLIEVFESVPNPIEVGWYNNWQQLGWPVYLSFEWATNQEGLGALAYTDWPRIVGGRENIERRVDVPYKSLTTHPALLSAGYDGRVVDPQGRAVVPYQFCSDEQGDLNLECSRYDAGADHYESMQSIIDAYWNNYIFTNFRRNQVGFHVGSATGRIYQNYFRKMQRANQSYALYRTLFQEVFPNEDLDHFFTAERGFGAYTAAVGAAYQALTRVIAAPEPGNYGASTRADGSPALLSNRRGNVEVNAFDGRFLETRYDLDAGYFWFDQLDRVGYFYDKAFALIALTDPTTYFVGRDTDADIRRYQLNFATTFGPSMTNFFAGLLGDDWSVFAPRVVDGELVYPDALDLQHGDMDGTPLAPNVSFSIQLYAAIFGMAFIPQTYDQDFLNRARIWAEGSGEAIDIDPSRPTVSYTDPDSGITYTAVSYLDEDGVERGVGARLIQHAQALNARKETDPRAAIELNAFIDNIDMVRRLTWHLGFGAQP